MNITYKITEVFRTDMTMNVRVEFYNGTELLGDRTFNIHNPSDTQSIIEGAANKYMEIITAVEQMKKKIGEESIV